MIDAFASDSESLETSVPMVTEAEIHPEQMGL